MIVLLVLACINSLCIWSAIKNHPTIRFKLISFHVWQLWKVIMLYLFGYWDNLKYAHQDEILIVLHAQGGIFNKMTWHKITKFSFVFINLRKIAPFWKWSFTYPAFRLYSCTHCLCSYALISLGSLYWWKTHTTVSTYVKCLRISERIFWTSSPNVLL